MVRRSGKWPDRVADYQGIGGEAYTFVHDGARLDRDIPMPDTADAVMSLVDATVPTPIADAPAPTESSDQGEGEAKTGAGTEEGHPPCEWVLPGRIYAGLARAQRFVRYRL